jgi:hypothetical protein
VPPIALHINSLVPATVGRTSRLYEILTRERAISTESLCRHTDTSSVVAQFLTGVIVGILIGLALAPLLRSWLLWQHARASERDR